MMPVRIATLEAPLKTQKGSEPRDIVIFWSVGLVPSFANSAAHVYNQEVVLV